MGLGQVNGTNIAYTIGVSLFLNLSNKDSFTHGYYT